MLAKPRTMAKKIRLSQCKYQGAVAEGSRRDSLLVKKQALS
jgi:hypothetical protein